MVKTTDYKTLNEELEQILDDLQAGNLSIDEALARYERGEALVALLMQHLEQAKNTIKKIQVDDAA